MERLLELPAGSWKYNEPLILVKVTSTSVLVCLNSPAANLGKQRLATSIKPIGHARDGRVVLGTKPLSAVTTVCSVDPSNDEGARRLLTEITVC